MVLDLNYIKQIVDKVFNKVIKQGKAIKIYY
jgi:hypothetical protein